MEKERPLETLWVYMIVTAILFLILFAIFAFKYRSLEDKYRDLAERVYYLEVKEEMKQ